MDNKQWPEGQIRLLEQDRARAAAVAADVSVKAEAVQEEHDSADDEGPSAHGTASYSNAWSSIEISHIAVIPIGTMLSPTRS